jgi:hypothetical protein
MHVHTICPSVEHAASIDDQRTLLVRHLAPTLRLPQDLRIFRACVFAFLHSTLGYLLCISGKQTLIATSSWLPVLCISILHGC